MPIRPSRWSGVVVIGVDELGMAVKIASFSEKKIAVLVAILV
jgi:hypothetical protein